MVQKRETVFGTTDLAIATVLLAAVVSGLTLSGFIRLMSLFVAAVLLGVVVYRTLAGK